MMMDSYFIQMLVNRKNPMKVPSFSSKFCRLCNLIKSVIGMKMEKKR